MRVVIPTIGSRGDVQPFIALAQGMRRAGHGVTLASHPVMEALVESHGVEFRPIGPDIDLARKVAEIQKNSRSSAAGLMRAMRFSFDMLQRSHDDILELCRGADLVVVSASSAAGKNEADLLKLPNVSVTLMPWAIPWDDPQRSLLRRVVYRSIDGLVSLLTTRPLNRIRKKQGLPPVGSEGFTSLRLNLVPVSSAVYEPNPRWEPRHRVVGYWFAEEPSAWEPAQDLINFLSAGDPPILISFGAMSLGDYDAEDMVRLFINAVDTAGGRAVIQGWDDTVQRLDPSSDIYAAGSIPHSWLLPRCSAIVHHGGFGTTAAGLKAGIPALIVPHIADQFYWGKIVHELGAGTQPIPRAKLNENAVAEAMDALHNDSSLRSVAASISEQIKTERGIEAAIQLIEVEFN